MNSKETILITGGSGLLALNWALAMRNHFSVILGLHSRSVVLRDVIVDYLDLDGVALLTQKIQTIQPSLVIHTAGLTSVEQCEANPELAFRVNIDAAVHVATVCADLNISFVHISTDHLFDGSESFSGEGKSVYPKNVYGFTKAKAEAEVLCVYPDALVIRTNFYGWGPSYRRSFSDFIIDNLRLKKNIFLFSDVFFTPIIISELVKSVHELVRLKASGIFHVVGDERVSKFEFGQQVARQFNLNADLIQSALFSDVNDLVQRPSDMSLSNQKACGFLGRKLGNVAEHLAALYDQECNGLVQEIQKL